MYFILCLFSKNYNKTIKTMAMTTTTIIQNLKGSGAGGSGAIHRDDNDDGYGSDI